MSDAFEYEQFEDPVTGELLYRRVPGESRISAPEKVWLAVHGSGSVRVIEHPDHADYNETAIIYLRGQ